MNTLKAANPVAVTKRLFGLAGEAVELAGTVARAAVHAPVGVTKGVIHLAEAGAGLADTVARDLTYTPDVGTAETANALAAEAAAARGHGPEGFGMAHEAHGASRDEEHGQAALRRAEVEEIAEEAASALEGDVEPDR